MLLLSVLGHPQNGLVPVNSPPPPGGTPPHDAEPSLGSGNFSRRLVGVIADNTKREPGGRVYTYKTLTALCDCRLLMASTFSQGFSEQRHGDLRRMSTYWLCIYNATIAKQKESYSNTLFLSMH